MFSPSTRAGSTYERLESGMGPGRFSKRLDWKKVGIACGVLVVLVWLFGSRSDTSFATHGLDGYIFPSQGKIPIPSQTGSPNDDALADPTIPRPDTSTTTHSQTVPTSPETDPDLLGTVHCTAPYAPHLPLVQYALMIDAGSTGSRIHIYKFHNCGPSPAYEYEVFRMIQPGLSDPGHGTPQGTAASLDVLLDEAVRVVPASLHPCTPVAVKATAGLRLLGPSQSRAILEAVESRLRTHYPFAVPERDGVVIMNGRDEGVYAWITVNYLLDTIRGTEGLSTYAVLDLGGGSTQIVFEPQEGMEVPTEEDEDEDTEVDVGAGPGVGVGASANPGMHGSVALKDGDHKYELAFGGEQRMLYQHSYLGYGLKSARASVHRLVEFMDTLRTTREKESELLRVANPCLAQGTTKEVEVSSGEGKVKVLMAGEDVGSFEACNRILELVMAKDAVCEVKPCSFNGVYQPSLLDSFPTGKILLLSYFYDRIMPLIPIPPDGAQPRITIAVIAELARRVCAGPSTWVKHWGAQPEVIEELEGRPEWCLDLTFMHALLGLGYEFEDVRDVELGKRIRGTELGWCLGATIAMVGGEIKCRA